MTTPVNVKPPTHGKAVTALVLSIFGGAPCFFFLAPFGIALGRKARREIESSNGHLGGSGMATAAIVLGWIDIILAVVVLGGIALLIAAAAFASS